MKVLYIGDGIGGTGFGRVSGAMIPRLIANGVDVVQFAINATGDPTDTPWKVYPACDITNPGDSYGVRKLARVVALEQPDVIAANNDFWICEEYVKVLTAYHERVRALSKDPEMPYPFRICLWGPVDATGYTRQRLEFLEHPAITGIATYTAFGKDEIQKALSLGFGDWPIKVNVIPHGADTGTFFPIPREEARVRLGLGEALARKFVVLNANRNQYRKRIDLTILGFCRFLKESGADAVLWLHMAPQERVGWNTEEVFTRECHRLGIDCESVPRLMYTDPHYNPSNPVPVESLNLIYNACDVGINTCSAEGFGLANFEMAACGKLQIVPYHSCFPEIYEDNAIYITGGTKFIDQGTGLEHQMLDTWHVSESIMDAYAIHKQGPTRQRECTDPMLARVKSEQYDWDRIALKFHAMLKEGTKG